MNSGITKRQSVALYGLAILFMLYHHLFCIPQRIGDDYTSLWEILRIPAAEQIFSWFCKLCVGIYAFISGYGIYHSTRRKLDGEASAIKFIGKAYKMSFLRIYHFMLKYWLVFVIFIPMGFLLGDITFNLKDVAFTFLGIKSSYCGEWWYVRQYLLMIAAFPAIHLGFDFLFYKERRTLRILLMGIILAVLGALIFQIIGPTRVHTLIFTAGYICARLQIFQRIILELGKLPVIFQYSIGALLVIGCVVLRTILAKSPADGFPDILIAPVMVFAFCILTQKNGPIFRFLEWLGQYSVYMWLTHTFFCYYYFKKFVTITKFSTTIFLTLLALSLATAWCLKKIEGILTKALNYAGERKKLWVRSK